MDSRRFDVLSRPHLQAGSRRVLLAALAAIPVLGGLAALSGVSETEARRRRRRKGPQRRRRRCKCCLADSDAITCAGKCGGVLNNCRTPVDCGSCACQTPCADGEICQIAPNTPGVCVPDPEQAAAA